MNATGPGFLLMAESRQSMTDITFMGIDVDERKAIPSCLVMPLSALPP
jgi:hypothetical protein